MNPQRRGPTPWCFVWAALAWLLPGLPCAQAAESYYILIFSLHDAATDHKDRAHSFAVFVRATNDGTALDPARCRLETHTISWLPASLQVNCRRWRSEPGVNLDLATTLCWGAEHGLCLSLWGPYEIEKCLYDDSLLKKQELDSGCLRYKAIDAACKTAEISNCIHTITDLVLQTASIRLCTPCWGQSASYFIAQACVHRLIAPERTHDWLLARLDLADRPLVRQRLEDGNPNPRPWQRRLQDSLHQRLIEKRQR
ncbi:MAG: hypothetical protein JNM56_32000 [Planctomycetia bacterium]|nr:hypothetical protein [Planctomycetia bacterium]